MFFSEQKMAVKSKEMNKNKSYWFRFLSYSCRKIMNLKIELTARMKNTNAKSNKFPLIIILKRLKLMLLFFNTIKIFHK